jgi:hypothetical protein
MARFIWVLYQFVSYVLHTSPRVYVVHFHPIFTAREEIVIIYFGSYIIAQHIATSLFDYHLVIHLHQALLHRLF